MVQSRNKASRNSFLEDTTWSTIVCDELENTAGGIERCVHSIMPHVEEAVIADTGSKDGTREILEKMEYKYSNLKVIDIPLTKRGYGEARNNVLKYVKTKRILVLDADEVITYKKPKNDWAIIKQFVDTNPAGIYNFVIEQIFPNGDIQPTNYGPVRRLFENSKKIFFKGMKWELLYDYSKPKRKVAQIPDVTIKHFRPSIDGLSFKNTEWYNSLPDNIKLNLSPSQTYGVELWKKFNGLRNHYK